jgi:hypothetical protein
MISSVPASDSALVLPVPKSLVASAAQIKPNDQLWGTYRFTMETWQTECWRYFHTTPELHYITDYVGSACSRVRIFVADVDELGRVGDEVTDDNEIVAISDTLFGGPASKAEALKAIGANLTIAGECYIIGKARRGFDPDSWSVVSTTELKRRAGQITIDFGYGPEKILSGTDLVIRLWTPDPERMRFADSSTRSCMEQLYELEQLNLFELSQIDSRLSGAGLYWVPAEMSSPVSDSTAPQSADDLFQILAEAARAARTQRGAAGGVVPVFVEIPGEFLKDMPDKPVRFDSELSDKVKEYRETAIRRIANGMNIPQEVLLGMGDTNHLSSWHIEESFVKIHIEPLMNRICDGLTRAYLQPLLQAMGKDPERYQLAFDTAPLTVRPNRLQDTINLYTLGIANAHAVLIAGNYNPATDAMEEEEDTRKFVRTLMERDPTLINVPQLVEAAGLDIEMPEPLALAPGDLNAPGPAAPPTPQRSVDNQPRPVAPGEPGPSRGSQGGTPILASGEITFAPDPILAASNVVVRRALELAGGQLLTRQHRGQWPDLPKFELHTKIRVPAHETGRLLDRGFDYLASDLAAIDVDVEHLERALRSYCADLLIASRPHDIEDLRKQLRVCGLI